MRMMGEQFVTGETIEEAVDHAKVLEDKGFRYSYDMLGEAALTEHDAERYFNDYTQAIHAIGKASNGKGVYDGPAFQLSFLLYTLVINARKLNVFIKNFTAKYLNSLVWLKSTILA